MKRILILKEAYSLTHSLRMIFSKNTVKDAARLSLARWYNKVDDSGFKSFNVIAATLYEHYDEVLNFFVTGQLMHLQSLLMLKLRRLEGSPDKSGGKFFNSIENLHLCTMNNQGLLALAQLILPSEILSNFEVVRVEEEASLIRIYLDESVKAEYKENPEIESKGFCEAVTIRDFPIRDKGVDLIVRRRKWYDKQNNRYFSDSYDLKAEETRYSKEFAAFLKGVYGDDSYDLPFA